MYAIAPLANAIVAPPIPEPRPHIRPAGEASSDQGLEQAPRRRWRATMNAVTSTWLSFVPRLRNDPR